MAQDFPQPAPLSHHSSGLLIFALCFFSYVYFYQGGGWNQNSRFDLTRAIVEQQRFAIDAYAANTGDTAARDGHIYCDKAPGQALLAVPVYALFMHGREATPANLNAAAYLITVVTAALPGALAVWVLFALLMSWRAPVWWAVASALGYGLATLAWPYATLLFGHQLVAALLLFAFALLQGERAGAWRTIVAAGLCLGLACMVEYQALLGAVAIGALTARRGLRAMAALIVGALPPLLVLAFYHWQAFGAPWALAYEFSTMPHRHQGFFMGLGIPDLTVLREISLGPYRGLFYSAPWLVLAMPGALLWLRGPRAVDAMSALGVVVLYVWMNASLIDWQGGWTYGPRFLVPTLPFLAVLVGGLGTLQWRSVVLARVMGAVMILALGVSYGATLLATAINPQTPLGIARPFGDYLLPQWRANGIALSTQGIDMKWPQSGAEPAAWNLGQGLGFSGRRSLLPLVAVQLMCGAWLLARVVPRRRAVVANTQTFEGDA